MQFKVSGHGGPQACNASALGFNVLGVEKESSEVVQLILGQELDRPPGMLPGSVGLPTVSFSALASPAVSLPTVSFSALMASPVFRNDPELEQIPFRVC